LCRPELRGDRLPFVPCDREADTARFPFRLGKAAKQVGRAFLGLPAFRIDRLVGRPVGGVEALAYRDLDLLCLALERRPHPAWPRGPVFGETAPVHFEHVIVVALLARDEPTCAAERPLEPGGGTVLVRHWP